MLMEHRSFLLHGILLAAGEGKRFSGVKQLAQINSCSLSALVPLEQVPSELVPSKQAPTKPLTLIENACDTLLSLPLDSYCVMLGAHSQLITPVLSPDVHYRVTQDWHKGMGHTLSQAMLDLPEKTSHVGIFLADQVKLKQQHYETLIQSARTHPNKIIAARFNQRFAAPCIFPAQYFEDLQALNGDTGAKSIVKKNAQHVSGVDIPEAELDIDTQEDLREYLRQSS